MQRNTSRIRGSHPDISTLRKTRTSGDELGPDPEERRHRDQPERPLQPLRGGSAGQVARRLRAGAQGVLGTAPYVAHEVLDRPVLLLLRRAVATAAVTVEAVRRRIRQAVRRARDVALDDLRVLPALAVPLPPPAVLVDGDVLPGNAVARSVSAGAGTSARGSAAGRVRAVGTLSSRPLIRHMSLLSTRLRTGRDRRRRHHPCGASSGRPG